MKIKIIRTLSIKGSIVSNSLPQVPSVEEQSIVNRVCMRTEKLFPDGKGCAQCLVPSN